MFLRLASAMSVLCFVLTIFTLGTGSTTALPMANETDRQALLAIKDLVQGDAFPVFGSWNHSIHFCKWEGVTCGRKHQRVIILDLSSRGLVGSLSPYIGNLTFLRMIDLSKNNFHGTIPKEIGRLFRLQRFILANNSFEGKLPTNITGWSNIKYINLVNNSLGGEMPVVVSSLSSLTILVLGRNNFRGSIPASFGNLSALSVLSLAFNKLSGSIPYELGRLYKLRELLLPYNNLTEYGLGEEISTRGDMYSYGVLILEMFIRKRPTDCMFTETLSLSSYTKMFLPDKVLEIIDPWIILEEERHPSRTRQTITPNTNELEVCLASVLQIGVSCCAALPSERMNARDVLGELHRITNLFIGPREQGKQHGRMNDS